MRFECSRLQHHADYPGCFLATRFLAHAVFFPSMSLIERLHTPTGRHCATMALCHWKINLPVFQASFIQLRRIPATPIFKVRPYTLMRKTKQREKHPLSLAELAVLSHFWRRAHIGAPSLTEVHKACSMGRYSSTSGC